MKTLMKALLLAAAIAPAALGQTPPQGEDPLARYLYPPEKILSRAEEISLSDNQRKMIRDEVHKAQSRFLDLQFELQPEAEKVAKLLQDTPVDEGKVLAQVDKVLALEREIKRTHLSLLIRLKNLLTAAQRAKLSATP